MYFPHAFRKSFLPSTVAGTTLTSSSSIITTTGYVISLTSYTGVAAGQSISGAGIQPGTTIVNLNGTTSVTLSLPITAKLVLSTTALTINVNGATPLSTTPAADVYAPNTIIANGTITGVSVGQSVSGTNIPAGTIVTGVSGTILTISQNVTGNIGTGTAGATITIGASVPTLSTGSTGSLTAGQIGFFSPDGVAVQAASAKPFIIAQGSYFLNDKISPALGGYKESVKTKMINPKYISRVIKITAKSARQMIVQVPVAVNTGLAADTTYRLRVDAKGSPALRFLSHNMYRTLDSYTGCANATDPTLLKDPVVTLLNWADQINLSPIFNTMVQARVYKMAYNATGSTTSGSITTTSAVLSNSNFTTGNGVAIGQKVVGVSGSNIPANSFVTAITSGTSVTITYPAQATAPAIGTIATLGIKFYTDLYSGALSTYGYNASVAGGAVSTPTYIPATNTESGVGGSLVTGSGTATGATIGAIGSTGGAQLYNMTPADAASFTVDAHLELYAAYIETKFGICTFTPTDKYDLEPLLLYTSIVDESGDPCVSAVFTGTNNGNGMNTSANDATVVQTAIQASGIGETILRDFILSDRYLQNAYPDSSRVESLRMREIEQNPALSNISRTSLYDQVMILHSVPRFNNPTATFDNDQYLLVFNVPTGTSTTALTNYIVSAVTAAGNTIPTNTAGGTFEQF